MATTYAQSSTVLEICGEQGFLLWCNNRVKWGKSGFMGAIMVEKGVMARFASAATDGGDGCGGVTQNNNELKYESYIKE